MSLMVGVYWTITLVIIWVCILTCLSLISLFIYYLFSNILISNLLSLPLCLSSSSALGVCWQRKEHHGRGFGPGPPATHHPLPLLWIGDRWCWGEVLHCPGPGKKGELSKKRINFDNFIHTFGLFHDFSTLLYISPCSSMSSRDVDCRNKPPIGWLFFNSAFLFSFPLVPVVQQVVELITC